MGKSMKKLIIVILSMFLFLSCNEQEPDPIYITDAITSSDQQTLDILSFNIQIFGRAKASKPEVMDIIVDIIDDYDLISIQEMRDSSGDSARILYSMMPEYYEMWLSPREGRSNSKEQVIILYDTRELDFIESTNYPDPQDIFERSPYTIYFRTDNGEFDFNFTSVHLAPGDVDAELLGLVSVINSLQQKDKDIILVGDFNADGRYFDEDEIFDYFNDQEYEWVITNEFDTTVAPSDNTYDRIIINQELVQFVNEYGTIVFDDLVNGFEVKEVSDHYPVYMKLDY